MTALKYDGLEWAAIRRQRMLDELTAVVERCNCLWPVRKLRNRHGHDPSCPVAEADKRDTRGES